MSNLNQQEGVGGGKAERANPPAAKRRHVSDGGGGAAAAAVGVGAGAAAREATNPLTVLLSDGTTGECFGKDVGLKKLGKLLLESPL